MKGEKDRPSRWKKKDEITTKKKDTNARQLWGQFTDSEIPVRQLSSDQEIEPMWLALSKDER